MRATLAILALMGGLLVSGAASAKCVCRCVEGLPQSVCENPNDVPAICGSGACPPAMPSIAPPAWNRPTVPPVGTTDCPWKQVVNPRTGVYEWRQICE